MHFFEEAQADLDMITKRVASENFPNADPDSEDVNKTVF